jgi:hypothetical protein
MDLSLTVTLFLKDPAFLKTQSSFSIQKSHVMKFPSGSPFGEISSNHMSGTRFQAVLQSIDYADRFIKLLSLFEESPIVTYFI